MLSITNICHFPQLNLKLKTDNTRVTFHHVLQSLRKRKRLVGAHSFRPWRTIALACGSILMDAGTCSGTKQLTSCRTGGRARGREDRGRGLWKQGMPFKGACPVTDFFQALPSLLA